MAFALPGPRLMRWIGIDIWTKVDDVHSAELYDEFEGGFCYYPTNG